MDPIVFYKAIADSTRLKALLLLWHKQELCVCDLMQALDESQPKVSRHLAILKQVGLVQHRKQGLWVYYSLSAALPGWTQQVLRHTTEQNTDFLQLNLARLAQQPANSCC
ncbi:MAG: metalloregulator ArsR/SmtB family transcription factor [Pseudomonadota bacterium]|uniref:metalloregulator ArsR/SmtB family transcription factor n=1 Tax=Rheinheimera fenheensis TaxID=3152295 RepID=UPI00325F0DB4